MQCYLRGSRQLSLRKMFQSMLVAYAILVLCNVAPEAPSNIEQEKIQAMSFQQHLITVFTYVYTRYFMSGKKKHYAFFTMKISWKKRWNFTQQLVKLFIRHSKKLKLLVSHAMLLKPMQSCPAVSVKCWDQDCISC